MTIDHTTELRAAMPEGIMCRSEPDIHDVVDRLNDDIERLVFVLKAIQAEITLPSHLDNDVSKAIAFGSRRNMK